MGFAALRWAAHWGCYIRSCLKHRLPLPTVWHCGLAFLCGWNHSMHCCYLLQHTHPFSVLSVRQEMMLPVLCWTPLSTCDTDLYPLPLCRHPSYRCIQVDGRGHDCCVLLRSGWPILPHVGWHVLPCQEGLYRGGLLLC